MTWIEAGILFLSGTLAGVINAVVGSGSLVTFPILLAFGYPPVLANVTNNVGILPGSVSGAIAYREELKGQLKPLGILIACSAIGGLVGALLLLQLPESTFDQVVPVLIILACALVVIGPSLKKALGDRRNSSTSRNHRMALLATTGFTGVYGGYFGAAQGVLLLSSLSVLLPGSIQHANAYKNVLAATANIAAAVVFVTVSQVAWAAAGCIAVGAVLGGYVGGRLGRLLPAIVFRLIVVLIGVVAVIYFYAM